MAAPSLPRGRAMLVNPLVNRGTAFSHTQRAEHSLEGLLSAKVSDISSQAARVYAILANLHEPLAKYRELAALQDRNEYLFLSRVAGSSG